MSLQARIASGHRVSALTRPLNAATARIGIESHIEILAGWSLPMASHQETLSRQWLMLLCVPRYPRKITARQLVERLHAEGHGVAKRTVERDLAALAAVFPLVADERAKPFGWSWQKDAPQFSLPGMSPLQAMVLALARQHLQALMPAHLLEYLSSYFRQADATLQNLAGDRKLATWSQRVALVQPTQPLLPPVVDEAALAAVHEALLQQRQLEVRYRSRTAGAVSSYRLHPLAIVYRGTVGYLVATVSDYGDPRSFALHRIENARVLEGKAKRPKNFVLEDYVRSGAFGFQDNGPMKLVMRMDAPAAEHLHETALSEDQVITSDKMPGWVQVEATVLDTSQLRWWLLGFGAQVEVLKPATLRKEMIEQITAAAELVVNNPRRD